MLRDQPAAPSAFERGAVRALRVVTVVRAPEVVTALLLTLESFLLIFGYYQIKAAREGLLLAAHPATVKSYLAIPQMLLILPVIAAFARLASRVPRHLLVTWVTLFSISNLLVFVILGHAGVPVAVMGIVFFVWIGVFNLTIPAQFWGFANDLCDEESGRRLFPLIALGASLGGVAGPLVARRLIPQVGCYGMMLVTSAVLLLTIALTWIAHARDLREHPHPFGWLRDPRRRPLDPGGGFRLVLDSRYLLAIAVMVLLYNFVNALGEYMFSDLQRRVALRELGPASAGSEALQNYIGAAFAGYQWLANVIGLVVQLLLVSRVFRWIGVGGALLLLPLIALGGYGVAAFGASLLLLKWVKAVENGVDYSLMKTARSALFLVTQRTEKYKAQAAVETFFVRGGDALCAAVVWAGTAGLALSVEGFAIVNVLAVSGWLALAVWIGREHARRSPASRRS